MSILIGTGPSDLYNAASDLLAAAAEALAMTDAGVQARQYVSPNTPSWDCEQLTVNVGTAAVGDTLPLQPPLQPGLREGANRAVRVVAFTITSLRCIPVVGNVGPKLPSPAAISAAAKVIDDDLWAIWNHLATLKRQGLLFPPAKDRVMFFDPAVPLQAQGGIVGWAIQVRPEMPAYEEAS